MSEAAKFSSKDIKDWLERETGSLLTPIHAKAQKMLNEMRKTAESLSEVSKMLLENSAKEIEKRNQKTYGRARALNKLARLFVDRMRQIKVPDEITYDTFRDFVQDTQKAFMAIEIDVRNFFPHVSPFFILDRRKFQVIFDRAKDSLKELNSFLIKEYVKAKTAEEAFLLIDRLHALERQFNTLEEQKAKTDGQRAQIEKEIVETQQRMVDLRSRGSLSQLDQTDQEISALSVEVKQSLQHLQKPFIKLQSLATRGEGSGLTPEETSKLNQYVENPFEAFATEEPNHPLLRRILQKLDYAMSEDKLKLKREKTRKAEQLMESILNQNSLVSLHRKSMNVMVRRKRLSASAEVAETEKELSKLREQLDAQERRKKVVEGEQVTLERTVTETVEKIHNHKVEIEKKVFESMSKKVRIE